MLGYPHRCLDVVATTLGIASSDQVRAGAPHRGVKRSSGVLGGQLIELVVHLHRYRVNVSRRAGLQRQEL